MKKIRRYWYLPWKIWSLDLKLFFFYLLCLFVLGIKSPPLPASLQLWIAIGLMAILAGSWLGYRFWHGWHWPGAGLSNILAAVLWLALGYLLYEGVFRINFLSDPGLLLYPVIPASMFLFQMCVALRLLEVTTSSFASHCGDRPQKPPAAIPAKPADDWKHTATIAFRLSVWLVMFSWAGFFWQHQRVMSQGSPEPRGEYWVAYRDKDQDPPVYTTRANERILLFLKYFSLLSCPVIFIAGAVLHLAFDVPVYHVRHNSEDPDKGTMPEEDDHVML